MRVKLKRPPRVFYVGKDRKTPIADCGEICLAANEQVTFVTPSGRRHDVAAKSWGFYATASTNSRLKKEGFRSLLAVNGLGRFYVMLVDKKRMKAFRRYLAGEGMRVIRWLG
jgi:hypothetical protein